jgi:hypothetical protein
MIAGWKCSCGATFENARDSFLHRDGTDFHQVNPYVSKLTGIEKQSLQTEIQTAAKGGTKWQPQ